MHSKPTPRLRALGAITLALLLACTIPAFTWAKFRSVGPMPDAIQKVNRQIFTEWLPNNNEYDMAGGVNIEMYTQGDMQAADYESEIWIPVRAKS